MEKVLRGEVSGSGSVPHHNGHTVYAGTDSEGDPIYVPCSGHSVTLETVSIGSRSVTIERQKAVIEGDTGYFYCPCHQAMEPYIIIGRDDKVTIEGKKIAVEGCSVGMPNCGGTGTITSGGSNTVKAG